MGQAVSPSTSTASTRTRPTASSSTSAPSTTPVAGVSKVGALKRSSDVIEYKEGGNAIILKGLGRTKYEPITLERGVTHDTDFEDWANAAQVLDKGSASHVAGEPAQGDQRSSCSTRRGSRCSATSCTAAGSRSSRRCPTSTPARNAIAIEHIKLENEGWERDLTLAEPTEHVTDAAAGGAVIERAGADG